LKLLFDANLSPKLAKRVGDLFPASAHIFDEGLPTDADDSDIWRYAQANGFCLVTADGDFLSMAKRRAGSPPQASVLPHTARYVE
jgi:predicted nuclease of predicted toxin-antitoxin system